MAHAKVIDSNLLEELLGPVDPVEYAETVARMKKEIEDESNHNPTITREIYTR